MRFLWVDAMANADYNKGNSHGINGYFFDASDSNLRDKCIEARKLGNAAGFYVGAGWDGYSWGDGVELAEQVDNRLKTTFKGLIKPSFPKVQVDIEVHDATLILDFMERWRELNPKQGTSITFEPFQGGWMGPMVAEAFFKNRIRAVPQAYLGDMRRAAEDQVLRDLLRSGFPEGLVSLFYDAASLPDKWNGYAFTQGRLP